jgi:hypothetical protein
MENWKKIIFFFMNYKLLNVNNFFFTLNGEASWRIKYIVELYAHPKDILAQQQVRNHPNWQTWKKLLSLPKKEKRNCFTFFSIESVDAKMNKISMLLIPKNFLYSRHFDTLSESRLDALISNKYLCIILIPPIITEFQPKCTVHSWISPKNLPNFPPKFTEFCLEWEFQAKIYHFLPKNSPNFWTKSNCAGFGWNFQNNNVRLVVSP